MHICRYEHQGAVSLGLYSEDRIVPLSVAVLQCPATVSEANAISQSDSVLDLLVHGRHEKAAQAIHVWMLLHPEIWEKNGLPIAEVRLLRPIAAPGKILLLAGNYAAHVMESGESAPERAATFPYVFMKPSTTFNDPNASIPIPRVSPDHIDYECELGVIMGRPCRHVREENALEYVAGYTVVNDISDREYKPFPDRKPRPKDGFFDWLHGKWHDGFCPMGPCAVSAHTISNPKALALTLHVNGEVRQNASTAQMIFPVPAVIAFLSQSLTLLPGDVISTGTPEGVGASTKTFLRPGDTLEAAITGIGVLRNTMTQEA